MSPVLILLRHFTYHCENMSALALDVFLTGEFWLGLRKIHSLANQGNAVLQIQLEDWKQASRFVQYGFSLDGAGRNYTIHLTHLSGDFPDPMINHTGMMFSTKDRDNDNLQNSSCAHNHTGMTGADVPCMFYAQVMQQHVIPPLSQVVGGSTPVATPT